MTTTTVKNQAELLGALDRASGGDTIVLKDGHYGSLKLTADFSSTVTIRAEDRLGATISGLDLFGATNLTFDGINFYSGGNGGHRPRHRLDRAGQQRHRDRQLRGARQAGRHLRRPLRDLQPRVEQRHLPEQRHPRRRLRHRHLRHLRLRDQRQQDRLLLPGRDEARGPPLVRDPGQHQLRQDLQARGRPFRLHAVPGQLEQRADRGQRLPGRHRCRRAGHLPVGRHLQRHHHREQPDPHRHGARHQHPGRQRQRRREQHALERPRHGPQPDADPRAGRDHGAGQHHHQLLRRDLRVEPAAAEQEPGRRLLRRRLLPEPDEGPRRHRQGSGPDRRHACRQQGRGRAPEGARRRRGPGAEHACAGAEHACALDAGPGAGARLGRDQGQRRRPGGERLRGRRLLLRRQQVTAPRPASPTRPTTPSTRPCATATSSTGSTSRTAPTPSP